MTSEEDEEDKEKTCKVCNGLRRRWVGRKEQCMVCKKRLLRFDDETAPCSRCQWMARLQTNSTAQRIAKLEAAVTPSKDTPTGRKGAGTIRENRTSANELGSQVQGMDGASPQAARQLVEERKTRHKEAEEARQQALEAADNEATARNEGATTTEGDGQDATQRQRRAAAQRARKRRRTSGDGRRSEQQNDQQEGQARPAA